VDDDDPGVVAGAGVGSFRDGAAEVDELAPGDVATEEEEPGNMREAPKNFFSCGAGFHCGMAMSGPRFTVLAAEF